MAILVATALLASTMAMMSPAPSSAADGTILRSFTADAGACSVGTGLAFDGTSLLVSCNYNNVIAAVSPVDGHRVTTYTVAGMSAIGALAWDRGRNSLWACEGFGGNDRNVWLVDLATSTATFKFTTGGCVDGLGYDGTDDTLWTSADVSTIVNHYRPDGTLISANDVSGKIGDCGSSGIAVGGAYLFLTNNGCQQIFAVSKDFSQSSLFGTYPARLEDLECDDKTFAAQGKAAIWSKDAYDNVLNAFEANVGDCGFGGCGSGPAGDPLGLLETLGAINPAFRYNPQCSTARPVK